LPCCTESDLGRFLFAGGTGIFTVIAKDSFTDKINRGGNMQRARNFMILVALLMGGCAATGPTHTEVKSTFAVLDANQGRIFFYRASSIVGAAIQPDINLNGEIVGTSIPGGFFYKDVSAGNQIVSTSTEVERQLTFTIGAKETRYVRTSPSLGLFVGRIQPDLVPTDEAEKDLPGLHYTPYSPPQKK
jgi:hypothetical protein